MKILVSMPRGIIRDTFFGREQIAALSCLGEVVWNESDEHFTPQELCEQLHDVDMIVTGWGHPRLTAEMVKHAPKLRLIMHTGGTVGPIVDADIYEKTQIRVISGNHYYAESVAEGVLAYMLCALRKLDYYSAKLKQGIWLEGEEGVTEGLLDQTVGIVSLGTISKLLIEMAKPFRIKFKVYSTRRDESLAKKLGFVYADLDEIFSTCKLVSVHTASNPKTIDFINKHHFDLIREDAIFLNTSRGPVVNEADLIEALKHKPFRAVLDVYNTEPLPPDSPLMQLDNITLYPHMGGPTTDRRSMITGFLIEDAARFFSGGKLENEVTGDVAARMTQTG